MPDRPSDETGTGYVPISTVGGRFAQQDSDEETDPVEDLITQRAKTLAEIKRVTQAEQHDGDDLSDTEPTEP